ncbi:MAG TPA: flagellar basal body rod protein FlgB [Ignavibacteriaceae bacterium]|nr:flagellar basal body rod protein FlgB [Ignavibacteriaceae bacterium]
MAASSVKLLENLINYCSLKNKIISKNIANVGTQNYKREDVEFKSMLIELNSSAKVTNGKHIKTGPAENPYYEVSKDKEDEMLSGINNVDIDNEMAELAENTLLFKFASRKIGDYYRNIQNVIKGGSR